MTIKECIDIVDNIKPNQYTIRDKVMWLSFIDEIIINEVLKTHEGYDGRYDDFEGYSEDKLSVSLVVKSPYDRLYTAYLKMKIDGENGETARYNNSAALYNTYMLEFRKYYNKTHMPLDFTKKRATQPSTKSTSGLSEAEYENIKRDLTYIITELFNEMTSDANLYEIVTRYMQNNAQMLKGKEGYTPKKGVDYFTEEEVTAIKDYATKDVESKFKNINEKLNTLLSKSLTKTIMVNLLASRWVKENDRQYSQVLAIDDATKYSKVDLQPTMEQLAIFYEKDITFVTENDNGTITIYCIGQKPTNDYVIQATITEVVLDE